MKRRVVIVGGGVAGLAAAAACGRDALLLEKEGELGGLCRTIRWGNFTFDIAGHVLHFRTEEGRAFIEALLPGRLTWQERRASVSVDGRRVSYPFQHSLAELPARMRAECMRGLRNRKTPQQPPANFLEWTLANFGKGIARHFMIPFNEKFWQRPLDSLGCTWAEQRVPLVDRAGDNSPCSTPEIRVGRANCKGGTQGPKPFSSPHAGAEFLSQAGRLCYFLSQAGRLCHLPPSSPRGEAGSLPQAGRLCHFLSQAGRLCHSPASSSRGGAGYNAGYNIVFAYPTSGGIAAVCEALARRVTGHIGLNENCVEIDLAKRRVRTQAGHSTSFSALVSTMPLPRLVAMIRNCPARVREAARALQGLPLECFYVGVTGQLATSDHWRYFPERDVPFFRVVFSSNVSPTAAPLGMSSMIVEVSGNRSTRDVMSKLRHELARAGLAGVREMCILGRLRIPWAYPVPTVGAEEAAGEIRAFLSSQGVYATGRFGRWEHLSIEDSILAGLQAAEEAKRRR